MKNKKFYLQHLVFECPNAMQRSAHGGQCIQLKEGRPAEITLSLCEKPTAIYAYCNLHGLWKMCPTCEKTECA